MRRRSSILPSTVFGPVREDEVYGSVDLHRHSAVPRQLPFGKTNTGDTKLGRGRTSMSGRASIRPTPKPNESILAESILEDDCTITLPKALNPNMPQKAACGRVVKDQQSFPSRPSIRPSFVKNVCDKKAPGPAQVIPDASATIHEPKTGSLENASSSTLPAQKVQTTVASSTSITKEESMDKTLAGFKEAKPRGKPSPSLNISETKIPKPKIFSASKPKSPELQLDSTAAFEEVEIAALTSTPHPERSSRRKLLIPANSDQEIQLFLAEQRSVMQVMKLSFQKLNLVLDSQRQVNLETASLLKHIKESQGSFQLNPMLKSTLTSSDNLAHACSEKMSSGSSNHECDKLLFKKILSPCQEDKENVATERPFKPDSLYQDMKSQLGCLKTPTVIRKAAPLCTETPRTYLSNTVHHQVETLFNDN